jgi:hypothetical protein
MQLHWQLGYMYFYLLCGGVLLLALSGMWWLGLLPVRRLGGCLQGGMM